MEKNRWYDKYPKLSKNLESLKPLKHKQRDPVIKGILDIINRMQPELTDSQYALEFSLDLHRRRWYDYDPYLWLIFHGLQSADKEVIDAVSDYLERNL
ncbi:MAG: hypothetical protein ACOCSE_04535 [Chitinivibrionales bacterium]